MFVFKTDEIMYLLCCFVHDNAEIVHCIRDTVHRDKNRLLVNHLRHKKIKNPVLIAHTGDKALKTVGRRFKLVEPML